MAMSDYKVVQSSNFSSEIQSFRDVLIAFLGDNRNVSHLKSKISKWQSQFCLRENSKILKSWEKLHFFGEKQAPCFFCLLFQQGTREDRVGRGAEGGSKGRLSSQSGMSW